MLQKGIVANALILTIAGLITRALGFIYRICVKRSYFSA